MSTKMETTKKGLAPGRHVHADLVNLVTYAVYKSMTDMWGEKAWEVIYRSGEVAFEELRQELKLTETDDPLPLMQRLLDRMVEIGYVYGARVERISETELIYEMDDPVVIPSALRLKTVNAVLPHWTSGILLAALRRLCGIDAEMEDVQPEFAPAGVVRERWHLRRVKD